MMLLTVDLLRPDSSAILRQLRPCLLSSRIRISVSLICRVSRWRRCPSSVAYSRKLNLRNPCSLSISYTMTFDASYVKAPALTFTCLM